MTARLWRSYYLTGLHRDVNGAVEGGHHLWMGVRYYQATAYFNSSAGTRVNWMKNLIDAIDPAQLP
jgi:hypothetical protein